MNLDPIFVENLIKIGMAVLVGGIVGAEREFHDKAAGFRTIILITLGSALFTIFSISMDPGFTRTRVAANIVTGIGFLGAGAIIREGGRIAGLTTAATIWLAAALGMGIGAGDLYLVLAATTVTILVLIIFPKLELRIDRIREARAYKIVVGPGEYEKIEKISDLLQEVSLTVLDHHQAKNQTSIIGTWKTIGPPSCHEKFVRTVLRDEQVQELSY